MFDWWFDLPPILRAGVALMILGVSAVALFVYDLLWYWGWAAGGMLLMFSGKSSSEKNGYRF